MNYGDLSLMKFHQYKQQRDKTDFEKSFTALCEKMVMGNVSFEDWWVKTGIPVMMESHKYNSPEQLLNEGPFWDGMKRRLGMGGQPQQQQSQGGLNQRQEDFVKQKMANKRPEAVNYYKKLANGGQMHNPRSANVVSPRQDDINDIPNQEPQKPPVNVTNPSIYPKQQQQQQQQMSPQQQQKIAQYQQRADQEINVIKKKFAVAMKDFVKSVTNDAQNSGDHHSWQIARRFCDKINQATQPVVQAFTMKAGIGKADYKSQFDQARSQMQGNQQANAQTALKDKYSQGKPLQDLMNRRLQQSTGMSMGPDGQPPEGVQDAQTKMAMGGYDPFNAANYTQLADDVPPAAPQAVPGPRRRGRKGAVNPATGTNGMSFESVQDDMFVESLINQSRKTTNFSIMGF